MTAIVLRMSEVKRESVSWLWPNRVPRGKITILDGDPGLGKSTLALDIAARATRAAPMPDGSIGDLTGPVSVLLLSAEDGLGDTIRPRLEAAGADLTRVFAFDSVWNGDDGDRLPEIPADLDECEALIIKHGIALVIVDPLMAYLGGDTNSYRDQDIRRALSPVKGLAERTGAAVVVVRHLNKSSAANPLYRGGGSIGIIGAARSGLLVAKDPDDDERRIVAQTKSNVGPPSVSLAYRLISVGDTARIAWEGETTHTAAQLLSLPTGDESQSARGEAEAFLLDLLADGPLSAKQIQSESRDAGISERTLKRAKADLSVMARREGGVGASGRWVWELPEMTKGATNPYEGHQKSMAPLADSGLLRPTYCQIPDCLQMVSPIRPCPTHPHPLRTANEPELALGVAG